MSEIQVNDMKNLYIERIKYLYSILIRKMNFICSCVEQDKEYGNPLRDYSLKHLKYNLEDEANSLKKSVYTFVNKYQQQFISELDSPKTNLVKIERKLSLTLEAIGLNVGPAPGNTSNNILNVFIDVIDLLTNNDFDRFQKQPSYVHKIFGWKNPIYTLGLSLTGYVIIPMVNFNYGYYFEPKDDNLGYQNAYLFLVKSLIEFASSSMNINLNALDNMRIALTYLIKNSKDYGYYLTGPVIGGTIPIPISEKSWGGASLTIELGVYSGAPLKGSFYDYGGSVNINLIPTDIGFLGLGVGGNFVKNNKDQLIGITGEFGISLGPTPGPGIEGHYREGKTYTLSIPEMINKIINLFLSFIK